MRKSDKFVVALVVLLSLTSSFCFGTAMVKPEVITEYRPYPVEVIKVVKVPVEVIREVEVEKPNIYREFPSLEVLEEWLVKDNTNAIHLVSGRYAGEGTWVDPDYDCDNYSVDLILKALEDGYLVSMELEGDHMINSTIIGNEIYLIEPQTDKVWFWGYRD